MVDIAIAYRIFPGISKQPPIFSRDKLRLSELCLKSFVRALNGLSYRFFAVLDSCPPEYEDVFRRLVPEPALEFVRLDKAGNPGSFACQLELLANQSDARYLYFAEDDYFYLENALTQAIEFMDAHPVADFATLYDHPDYYTHPLHAKTRYIMHFSGMIWQSVPTTCMTFLARPEPLRKLRHVFHTYSQRNYDNAMWLAITKQRLLDPFFWMRYVGDRQMMKIFAKGWFHTPLRNLFGKSYGLYSVVPSLANHLDGSHDAPGIDWQCEYKKLCTKL